jgi:hypothetical protein
VLAPYFFIPHIHLPGCAPPECSASAAERKLFFYNGTSGLLASSIATLRLPVTPPAMIIFPAISKALSVQSEMPLRLFRIHPGQLVR